MTTSDFIGWFVYKAAQPLNLRASDPLSHARQLLGQHLLFPNARITYDQYLRSGEIDFERAVAKVKAGLS